MEKSFQRELLERRDTIMFKRDLKNITSKNTIKTIKTIKTKSDSDYLIIGDNLNKQNSVPNKSNETNGNLITTRNRRLSAIPEIDTNTVITKKLIIFGVIMVVSYIGITAINDYIMVSYF
jgi:hypothetical protein